MAYASLQDFVCELEAHNELLRITTPISQDLEISSAALTHMADPSGGKALLFENVKGQSIPVLINALGSHRRLALAFGGRTPDEIGQDINNYLSGIMKFPKSSLKDRFQFFKSLFPLSHILPKKRTNAKAPSQEIIIENEDVDLDKLPILKCWPQDGGRYVTFPMVITQHPETGARNVGMYRMQQYDSKTTGMHWHIQKGSASHYAAYTEKNQRMPVCVAIGGDPVLTFVSTCPLPPGIDEYMLAGYLRRKRVPLVKARSCDLWVPAQADIILEGYVDPGEERIEGPFGDHTGYYSLADRYPVFHVTTITMREKPIWFATVVGKPPKEDFYMGQAIGQIFLPMLQGTLVPDVVALSLPWEGVFHNCALVSIKKRFPWHARHVVQQLWGAGQMAATKMIIVVDDSVDLEPSTDVLRLFLEHVDFERDLFVSDGILDSLDHSAPQASYGAKLGIDLTEAVSGEPLRLRDEKNRESLIKTSPTETSLTETSLTETSLTEANPTETSLTEANPTETSPTEANSTEANPTETSPTETSPTETSLTETSPTETSLTETSPTETSPTEANPTEANLIETNIHEALKNIEPAICDLCIPCLDTYHKAIIISIKKESRDQLSTLSQFINRTFPALDIILFTDDTENPHNIRDIFWRFFNNTDPRRDINKEKSWIWIDSTKKTAKDNHNREWPDDNLMPQDLVEDVYSRLKAELGDVKPSRS